MKAIFRIVDANLNRAREGLRVCEEVARFVVESPALTRRLTHLRHGVERLARSFGTRQLLQARDARNDVGYPTRRGLASRHQNVRDVAAANFRRAEEALRVLEELSRLRSARQAQSFGRIRFRAYSLEQDLLSRLPSGRHR